MTSPFILPGQNVTPIAAGSQKAFKKADRFINLSGDRNDGTKARFDSIKLYKDNPDHAVWIAGLDSGELTVADFFASIAGEYRSAEQNASGMVIRKATVAPTAE